MDDAQPLVTNPIQVQVPARRGGGQRETRPAEAYSLILSALGAVNRWAGIRWKNAKSLNGAPLAVVLIPGVQFGQQNGRTILSEVAEPIER